MELGQKEYLMKGYFPAYSRALEMIGTEVIAKLESADKLLLKNSLLEVLREDERRDVDDGFVKGSLLNFLVGWGYSFYDLNPN